MRWMCTGVRVDLQDLGPSGALERGMVLQLSLDLSAILLAPHREVFSASHCNKMLGLAIVVTMDHPRGWVPWAPPR